MKYFLYQDKNIMDREGKTSPRKETDITFLLGTGPYIESLSTKLPTLVDNSPVFRVMLEGHFTENKDQVVRIEDVDPRAFEQLISFLSDGVVKLRSVATALAVVYAAKKYMVEGVDSIALMYISKNINSDNVLTVLQSIILLQSKDDGIEDTCPTAPPWNIEIGSTQSTHFDKKNSSVVESIVKQCFKVIDKHGDKVLASEEFEELSLDVVAAILHRDSLQLPSELSVLRALNRWSHRKCRRRHVSPSPVNKRDVLEGAQYFVRYITMTWDQFKTGQADTALLTKEEEDSILFCLLNREAVLTKDLQKYQSVMNTPRHKKRELFKHFWKKGIQNKNVKNNKLTWAEKSFLFLACILD